MGSCGISDIQESEECKFMNESLVRQDDQTVLTHKLDCSSTFKKYVLHFYLIYNLYGLVVIIDLVFILYSYVENVQNSSRRYYDQSNIILQYPVHSCVSSIWCLYHLFT